MITSQYHSNVKHRPGSVSNTTRRRRSKLLTRLVLLGVLFGISSSAMKRRALNGVDNTGDYASSVQQQHHQQQGAAVSSSASKVYTKLNTDASLRKQTHQDGLSSGASGDSATSSSSSSSSSNREREIWWHDLSSKCQFTLGQTLAPFGESDDVDARSELYAKMFRSTSDTAVLDIFNPSKTVIVQTANNNNDLTLDKVFVIDTEKDEVTPILEKLEIPVRAIVLPFPSTSEGAKKIGKITREVLAKNGFSKETSVWLQNAELYHASVYHASHHLDAHKAKGNEIREEVRVVKESAKQICPIKITLERIVITSSGALVSVWNTRNTRDGGEISEFRQLLHDNLPNAPVNQIVSNKSIIHATLARFLGTTGTSENAKNVARELTNVLCGLEMTLPMAWFVEERHTLALALEGEYDTVGAPFRDCHVD
ncbi:unnamed protein product [Bathycoccus prasinos]